MAVWFLFALAVHGAWLAIGFADDIAYDRHGQHTPWLGNADRVLWTTAALVGLAFIAIYNPGLFAGPMTSQRG